MGYGSVFTHGKRQLKFHGVFYILNIKYQLHRAPNHTESDTGARGGNEERKRLGI